MSACRYDSFSNVPALRHAIESATSTVPEPEPSPGRRLLTKTRSLSVRHTQREYARTYEARKEGHLADERLHHQDAAGRYDRNVSANHSRR